MRIKISKNLFLCFLIFILILLFTINIKNKNNYVILLDPGHGGKLSADKGAIGVDSEKTNEYTLNDQVTIKLANALKKEGYIVKFTRQPYKDEKEVTLTNRTIIANKIKPDLLISIHHDSTGTKNNKSGYTIYYSSFKANLDFNDIYVEENGKTYPFIKEEINNGITTVYYTNGINILSSTGRSNVIVKDITLCKEAKQSLKFANILNEELSRLDYIAPLLANKNSAVKDNNFRILRMTNYPSVLIECGFISNKNEIEQLKNEKNQNKLVNAIVKSINKYF
ncbi:MULTISPECIES: N-acetylmuramoyl-L-alanine amidase [Anaerofustis]|uniref:N-acetylmuramoyl-L-alanine amidase family protein n=1 Tax=Anaerofustis TaxID=264995 RepID=UPI0011061B38|nr:MULTISPECIES: N-acetylmuramoyl-L-alanine amidase [Anaerofustis]MCO8194630.1 N-acetylmuramoyl-L-alanine amidase [Anaerofustis sp. NSJ-163]